MATKGSAECVAHVFRLEAVGAENCCWRCLFEAELHWRE
jgi:hypothetical protein